MQVTIKAGQRTIRLTKREERLLRDARELLSNISDVTADEMVKAAADLAEVETLKVLAKVIAE